MANKPDHRYIGLEVKCVSTGLRHDARAICFVAVIDYDETVLLQKTVKPSAAVVSYITPLTRLKEGDLDDGESIEDVLAQVKKLLGPDVILVGQGVNMDISWLRLEKHRDFEDVIELADVFKTYKRGRYYQYPLRHEADILLHKGKYS